MATRDQDFDLMVSRRIFPLVGVNIDFKTIPEMQKVLLRMVIADSKAPANLLIDCGGGDVNEALKAYDLIKALPFEVHCIIVGSCHSATLTLISACTKRFATKHSRFLFHAIRGNVPIIFSTEDGEEQIKSRVMHQNILTNQTLEIESKAFGISVEKLKEMRIQGERYDVRLTAEQALEKGVIHGIVEKAECLKFTT